MREIEQTTNAANAPALTILDHDGGSRSVAEGVQLERGNSSLSLGHVANQEAIPASSQLRQSRFASPVAVGWERRGDGGAADGRADADASRAYATEGRADATAGRDSNFVDMFASWCAAGDLFANRIGLEYKDDNDTLVAMPWR
ncbi:hypothetical protein N9L68_02260 [bacterium]|nr:hypothetical protein [bacterium]